PKLEARQDEPASDQPWYNIRSPINLEAKANAQEPWYNIRIPLNLEAKESVGVNGDAAAQPWWDVRTALNLEAKEAKQLVIGGGQKLESLVGSDQLHLLVGGSMLLVAGVVVNFVRRARNRKVAEKQLEDETYLLMA
ncbi:Phosphatase ptc7 family protein, partial [Globisporangium polare]